MALNWVDWLVIAICVYELYRGWIAGFLTLGTSLLSFILALWVSVRFQAPVTAFFSDKFGIQPFLSTLLAYVAIIMAGQMVFFQVLALAVSRLPKGVEKSPINGLLGALVSCINALTTFGIILLVILILPLKGTVQRDIRSSVIGGAMVNFFNTYGGTLQSTMDDAKKAAAKFLTIEPGSKESMSLDVAPKESELEIDDRDERQLLELVNKERASVGVPALVVDIRIVKVARDHSRDMFLRKYFSHYTPEGKDPGDRLRAGEVPYAVAGENIAFAPDVDVAHQGLMNSPDHKKNILDPSFGHVGIGIIQSSKYGLMVTEDFTN